MTGRLTLSVPGVARLQPAERRDGAARRGYGARWRRARSAVLAQRPLCEVALARGETMAGDTVDHLYPHLGLDWLFWDARLWLVCEGRWHSSQKQAMEARGEAALDGLALSLGYPTLAQLWPDRVAAWRSALRARR